MVPDMVGKPWWQGEEAAAPFYGQAGIRARGMLVFCTLSPFNVGQDPSPWSGATTVRVGLPSSS